MVWMYNYYPDFFLHTKKRIFFNTCYTKSHLFLMPALKMGGGGVCGGQ